MGDVAKDSKCMHIKRKLVEKSNGFAIDIGGSVVKIVYLNKDEWEKPKQREDPDELVKLYMKSFSRDDIELAMAFIKESVYIKRETPDTNPVIYTSGVGSNMMAARFRDELRVTAENTMEFDDFILALEFLMENYSVEEVFIPIPKKGLSEGLRRCATSFPAVESFATDWTKFTKMKIDMDKFGKVQDYVNDARGRLERGESLPRAVPRTYPYILGTFGSGFVFLKVEEDGSYILLDLISYGGKSFLDLGRTITGAKTYAELIALAESGHENNLNIRYLETVNTEANDIYSDNQDEMVVFSFGKLHGKDLSAVNKCDLARTLLHNICVTAISTAHHVMLAQKCTNLYLTGTFVTSEVTQNLLVQEFEAARTKFFSNSPKDLSIADLRMEIADCGSWMGCLGAFISGCNSSG